MAELNFGAIKNIQPTAAAKRLKPWDIYDVTFAGCRVDRIEGKKDPGKVYTILKIRFENEAGYYEESIFSPNPKDMERPKFTNKEGHEYEGPSNMEQLMAIISQLVSVVNNKVFEKFREACAGYTTFDKVCEALIKVTDPMKGKFTTKLKLVGRTDKDGNVNPALPRLVAVSKDGNLFTSDNFIGENVAFTAYEDTRRKAYLTATPTNMEKVVSSASDTPTVDVQDDLDAINPDDLLADLNL